MYSCGWYIDIVILMYIMTKICVKECVTDIMKHPVHHGNKLDLHEVQNSWSKHGTIGCS